MRAASAGAFVPAAAERACLIDASELASGLEVSLRSLNVAEAAIVAVRQSLPSDPADYLARAALAEALVDAGEPALALCEADAAARLCPDGLEPHAARTRALRALGRRAEALAALEAAIARGAGAAAYDARGVMLAEAGRFDEARAAYRAALERDPRCMRAYFGLASLGLVEPHEMAAMERLAAEPTGLDETALLYLIYALARTYEDAGDFARAFAAGSAGAALRRARGRWDETAAMRHLADAAPGAASVDVGDSTDAPIFVFGMPRSGTSLVEQILSRHPLVHALGETEWFAQETAKGDGATLAARYLMRLPCEAREAPRFVDKSLGNFLLIGALRSAFPNAKLVHVRRDPLDGALSCWLTWFSGEMPFGPDLGAVGRYWRGYSDLMRAWRDALPACELHEVQYERLVAHPETEIRALLGFCGLDWDPRCLSFNQSDRPVATASLASVRRPLFASSIGRAQRFAPYLGPLRAGLETPPPFDMVGAAREEQT